jgi:hypothetical protein
MARINGSKNSRPVVRPTTGEIFPSVTETAQHFKTKRARIAEVLTGHKETWKGLVFIYGIQ